MFLYEAMETPITILDRTTVNDEEGGTVTRYVDGATINVAIVFDSSMQARIADKQGVSSLYTVTAPKNSGLVYHTVFRRDSDNKVFRVTSDDDDKVTPEMATFSFTQVTAEEWVIPT